MKNYKSINDSDLIDLHSQTCTLYSLLCDHLAGASQDEANDYFNKKWMKAEAFVKEKNKIEEKRTDKMIEAIIDSGQKEIQMQAVQSEIYANRLRQILNGMKVFIDGVSSRMIQISIERKHNLK